MGLRTMGPGAEGDEVLLRVDRLVADGVYAMVGHEVPFIYLQIP